MNGTTTELAQRLAAMRTSFDEGFAQSNRGAPDEIENILKIWIGGNPFGIRIGEIQRIEVNRKRTLLPGALAGFRGIVGIRGQVVPVFSLSDFLGMENQSSGDEPWLVICNPTEPLALSFGRLEGCITATAPSWLKPSNTQKYIQGLLRLESTSLPVLRIPAILEEISKNNEKMEKR